MQTGYMGSVVFTVSNEYMLTPKGYERSGDARWELHSLLLQKPAPQFAGSGQQSISFELMLMQEHGIDPEEQLKTLRDMRDTGAVFPLVIGEIPIGDFDWYLESLTESDIILTSDGQLMQATAKVTLKEYDQAGSGA